MRTAKHPPLWHISSGVHPKAFAPDEESLRLLTVRRCYPEHAFLNGLRPPRPPPWNPCSATDGFSLVEVALAIGLVGVAFVGLLALVVPAQQQLKTAMDTTTAAQIARTVVSDLETAGLQEVLYLAGLDGANGQQMGTLPERYFTSAGREVAEDDSNRIYQVNLRVSRDEQIPGTESREGSRGCGVLTVEVVAAPAGVRVVIDENGLVDRMRSPGEVATFPYILGGHSAR